MVSYGFQTVVADLPHVGSAVAHDALAAVASAVALGVELIDAARGAEQAIGLPGVMQPVSAGQPFGVFLDRSDSPERLRAAINAARTAADARVLVVLPENPRAALRSVANALGDLVILPQQEAPPHATDEGATRFVEDRFSGLALGVALAEQGDVVLVAGSPARTPNCDADEQMVRQLIQLRLANAKEFAATH